jgi:hypothetical protein
MGDPPQNVTGFVRVVHGRMYHPPSWYAMAGQRGQKPDRLVRGTVLSGAYAGVGKAEPIAYNVSKFTNPREPGNARRSGFPALHDLLLS